MLRVRSRDPLSHQESWAIGFPSQTDHGDGVMTVSDGTQTHNDEKMRTRIDDSLASYLAFSPLCGVLIWSRNEN